MRRSHELLLGLFGCLPPHLTAERLLTEYRVVVAPGEGFGPSGAGWARLSLAVARSTRAAARSTARGGVEYPQIES